MTVCIFGIDREFQLTYRINPGESTMGTRLPTSRTITDYQSRKIYLVYIITDLITDDGADRRDLTELNCELRHFPRLFFIGCTDLKKYIYIFGDVSRVVSSEFNHFLSSRGEDHESISD